MARSTKTGVSFRAAVRELVGAGKSNEEVFSTLAKEYGLNKLDEETQKKRRGQIAWIRWDIGRHPIGKGRSAQISKKATKEIKEKVKEVKAKPAADVVTKPALKLKKTLIKG